MKKNIMLIGCVLASLCMATSLSGQLSERVARGKKVDIKSIKTENITFSRTTLPAGFIQSKTTESGLTADFSIKSESSADVVWSEGFDAGTTGWTFTTSNSATTNWKRDDALGIKSFVTIDSDDVASLFVDGHYRLPNEEAKAISPDISIPENAQLKFYLGYSLNFSDKCTLVLNISENGGEWKELWNTTEGEKTPLSWIWRTVKVDISSYAGKNIKLEWVFKGFMGNFTLDGITVSGIKPIENVSVKTGEKIKLNDLSTGNPTSWKWSFPGATPATSTEQNPEIYYTKDGVYDITLTVGNGSESNARTRSAFVEVTGAKPTAVILPPATFRDLGTRYPYIAPLTPVQYKDNSTNYPTEWTWAFTGIGQEAKTPVIIEKENPEVAYTFMGNQSVSLFVENQHGISDTTINVTAGYNAFVSNFQPNDQAFTFDLGDGFGSFPGSNKLKITEFAEKFSRPSKPILIYGVNAYFTKVVALELYEQLQSVTIKLCKSDKGIPGETLASDSWANFELDQPSGSQLKPTAFEFTKPVAIDEEFFIVISGILEKSDIVDVQMATAKFRQQGNTAYLNTRDGWKSAADYFPAGKNHTSILVSPLIAHSVMKPFVENNKVFLENEGGKGEFPLFSFMGYDTPVTVDADWCRITNTPNGLTLDTIRFDYDRLPNNLKGREAIVTLTDGLQTISVTLSQGYGSSVDQAADETLVTVSPMPFDNECLISAQEGILRISVSDLSGKIIYNQPLYNETSYRMNTSVWPAGIYLIRINTPSGVKVVKAIRK